VYYAIFFVYTKIDLRTQNYLRTYKNKSVVYIIQFTFIHSYFRIYTECGLRLNVIKICIFVKIPILIIYKPFKITLVYLNSGHVLRAWFKVLALYLHRQKFNLIKLFLVCCVVICTLQACVWPRCSHISNSSNKDI
jgi:hypothetical protein